MLVASSTARVQAVVFDLDGTLIDSRADIVHATNFTLRQHGHSELPADTIAGYVGDGARMLVARAFSLPADDTRIDAALSTFLERYTRHATDRTRPMPGAQALLDALGGLPLGVCTNKPRPTTDAVLGRLGLERHFRAVVAGGDVAEIKPHPLPLLKAAELLGVEPTCVVFVGDSHQDIECGRRAGARTIAFTGGFGKRATLEAQHPTALVDSLRQVASVLESWA